MPEIIDIHSHVSLYDTYHPDYMLGMVNYEKANITAERFLKIAQMLLNDKQGDKHVKAMDKAGISKSVLLIIDSEVGLGNMKFSIEEIYKIYKNILDKHSDRVIVFAGIDPRRGADGFSLFKKGIEEYNFRGLKLYPSFGFSMSHEYLNLYYAYCEKNNLPILFHTGPSIIPNVYFDISGFQSLEEEKRGPAIERIFDERFVDKILFGSDWPLFHNFSSTILKDIDYIKNIYENSPYASANNGEALNKIFYETAAKILSL